ncbi:Uma2 family endonuclease [Microcoleus sp. N9_B2]|uniref:Uma2 family endonuclease n=1 Tax=unclassified Microcoleus TaxID=2642155 RepID=UPI002FD7274E
MIVATSTLAEQRTLLENISWSTFETLLKEIGNNRGYRLAYDEGMLEIMAPLFEHENYKSNFGNFIVALAEELGIEIKSAGSTTLKLKNVKKGIEPDNCYYIQNEPALRGRQELDLETAPPPDLAIEIDITSSSLNKLAIYSALRVPELWRYNGRFLNFYQLVESEYIEIDFSIAFLFLSVAEMVGFFDRTRTTGEIALLKSFRTWVKGKIQQL